MEKDEKNSLEFFVRNECSMAVLAGGLSSRMGRNKADLMLNGRSFLDIQIEKGKKLGISEIFLSGYQKEPRPGIISVPDSYEKAGPLGGLEACFLVSSRPYLLILPVDVPCLPVSVLSALIETFFKQVQANKAPSAMIISHNGQKEPLIGIYSVNKAETLRMILQGEKRSVICFLEAAGYQVLPIKEKESAFFNINTPGEYQKICNSD